MLVISTLSDHGGRPCPRCRLACSDPCGTRAPRSFPSGKSSWRGEGRPLAGRPGQAGAERSAACDARGAPLGTVSEGTNRHDSPLLGLTLDATQEQVGMLPDTVNVNLDRGYDSIKFRALIAELGFTAEIARKGVPAPIQASRRRPVERTHS